MVQAKALRERGVAPNDKVAVLIPNVPEFTVSYFGILYAGATVVPINVLASAPEVDYFLRDSKAKLLIAHTTFNEVGSKGAEIAGVPFVSAGNESPRAPVRT